MIYAIQNEQRTIATPGARGTCPSCAAPVIAKCGKLISWHWAHVRAECDPFSEPMTQWHIDWQNRFPAEWQEVVIKRDGQTHRADVQLPSGKVIEFQHSPISVEDIAAREAFYGDMVWVFDCQEAFKADRIDFRVKDGYWSFRWKHPRKSLAFANSLVYLDIGSHLFLMKKMYDETPCGGWGYLISTKLDFLFPDSWCNSKVTEDVFWKISYEKRVRAMAADNAKYGIVYEEVERMEEEAKQAARLYRIEQEMIRQENQRAASERAIAYQKEMIEREARELVARNERLASEQAAKVEAERIEEERRQEVERLKLYGNDDDEPVEQVEAAFVFDIDVVAPRSKMSRLGY